MAPRIRVVKRIASMGRKPQATQLTLMIRPTTMKIIASFIVHLLDDRDGLLVTVRLQVDLELT